MNKITFFKILILSLLALVETGRAKAQLKVFDLNIQFNIEISTSGAKGAVQKMGEAVTTYQMKGAKSRSLTVSTAGNSEVIWDEDAQTGAILRQFSGQKIMIPLNAKDVADVYAKSVAANLKYTGKEQTILGIACKQMSGVLADGSEVDLFVSDQYLVERQLYNAQFFQRKELVMAFTIRSPKVTINYNPASISFDPLPFSTFDLPKTGYRLLSYEESKRLGRN